LTARGSVRLVGGDFELRFEHDIRLAHVARSLHGRRVALGIWRVPVSEVDRLARQLAEFELDWDAGAVALRDQAVEKELRFAREDDLAARVKAGEHVLGEWESPVALLPHQRAGVEFLAVRSSALLCDEQGLGKTLMCLVAFWLLRTRGEEQRLVVVCPNSLKHNWLAEATRFFPSWRVVVIDGSKRMRRSAYSAPGDVFILNYEAVRNDYADLRALLARRPSILSCDESHYAKNASSRTAKALTFARSAARRVWVMSGTPVPNRLGDVYAQVSLADGGRLLGTRGAFDREFGSDVDPTSTAHRLRQRLEPILLRRTKDQVLDLPERTFEERYVRLRGEQKRMYESLRSSLLDEVAALDERQFVEQSGNYLVRLLRLSQIASNPMLVDDQYSGPSAKLEEIDQLLEDLIAGNGRKVVLWSYYVTSITSMLTRYRRFSPVSIFGAVPLAGRREAVERFQADPSTMLLIANPQAAATGLTLTAAHYAVYESLTWRYDLYAQSLDRIHRIGQDRNVTYLTVLAEDTVEADILDSLKRKRDVAAAVLGDDVPVLTRAETMEMLQRRPS
jgi:SNF2 family DNA or RNA helicase